MQAPLVLVVDDDPGMRAYMRAAFSVRPYRLELADSGADALQRIEQGIKPDLVFLDVAMPGIGGIDTLAQLRSLEPELNVVMVSCTSDTHNVVRAIQLGALDYVTKPLGQNDLDNMLHKWVGSRAARFPRGPESAEIVEFSNDMFFACASDCMRKLRAQAVQVASCDIPVLLLGESGTGKEVIATLIHHASPRAKRPMLKVNCAAVPADLLESELFGYEVGAFTGAVKAKPGKFELADKGTILLDEIAEMPPALQAKLLHVLQDQEFSRLGGRTTTKVDVRVLAATNIDIQEAIAARTLRPDLYYRLNGVSLRLPALRDRKEEIALLMNQFMLRLSQRFARPAPPLTPRLLQAAMGYPWPGNLRELQNFVKRYLVLGDEELAITELTSHNGMNGSISIEANGDGGLKTLGRSAKDGAEAIAIAEALEKTNWRRKDAAILLKISYKALLYKMRQHDLRPPGLPRSNTVM
jgi:two-component system, NtrC family, response regulator AtoC